MDNKQTDWHRLYDKDTGRYQGRINIKTFTLILVGRSCDSKHELAPIIMQAAREKQATLQAQENVLS